MASPVGCTVWTCDANVYAVIADRMDRNSHILRSENNFAHCFIPSNPIRMGRGETPGIWMQMHLITRCAQLAHVETDRGFSLHRKSWRGNPSSNRRSQCNKQYPVLILMPLAISTAHNSLRAEEMHLGSSGSTGAGG